MTQPDLRVVAGAQTIVLRPSATRESSKELVDGTLVVHVPMRHPQVGDRHKVALLDLKADVAHGRVGRFEQLVRRAWLKVLKFDRRPHASKAQQLELTFGGLIDRLQPDVVYAPDPAALSVATRAADRAKLQKRALKVVHQDAGAPRQQSATRTDKRRLLIGPVNSAGQAWLWANALQQVMPAEALSTAGAKYEFAAHRTATAEQYKADLRWQYDLAAYVLSEVSHVLFEAGRPLFGQLPGQLWTADVPTLDTAGIKHGLIFHGSEIRDPARHRELFAHSPFQDPADEFTQRLQAANDALRRHLTSYDGPVFVTTPDLLDFVEHGTWLPLTVDVHALASDQPVLERERPVVLHAPSSGALKGSAHVDPVLTELDALGLITYQRVEGVKHAELAELVKAADIVVDQLALGSYGVLACEAMAAGRVTVGHVADRVRAQLPTELPIAEATPGDLRDVIERLVTERETARKLADSGSAYVRDLHDGRSAVAALLPFLGGR
ncbi:hypothetical protein GCM10009745_18650 [Kribbella yunnanensis]|uniref:Glycosyltransferase family 1 protein n=1 Tax=Kribbella yunnanensis TaxID=190194 RepID=A0ABP4SUJ9_9ACTN